ncbi:MAG: pseudaminic acid biosynthesis-associated methylase [Methylophaga sp.]|nr:MAG: pseudaminic acid biosynthesis-associated methylase [Methylophaga sp.]
MGYETSQEEFWAGNFGDDYIERNNSERLLASNLNFFSKALKSAGKVNSVVEFGSNIGMNLRALKLLFPEQKQFGIEINTKAANELKSYVGDDNVFNGSIFDFEADEKYELALIKGVLIHINPDMLPIAYERLYTSSKKYILIGEYYNPTPVVINYRGHSDKLYKRDFCGEMLDKYKDLKLVDYGFAYKKDPAFSQDDITWFLLEK